MNYRNFDAVKEALEDVEDYFDNRADVIDGEDGQPMPNKEMKLLQTVRAILDELKEKP